MKPFIYREFWDVPRMLFVLSEPVYLLDSPFDEEKDDYEETYVVYEIKNFSPDALTGSWFDIDLDKTYFGSVKVSDVQFDLSKRKEIDMKFLNDLTQISSRP